jgi:hypothetical protein
MTEIKANSTTKNNVTYMIVQGLGSPVGVKDPDKCGIMPEYIKGATCYRVCGEIPVGREPRQVEFLTRASYQGEHTPWQACGGDGCEGAEYEFDRKSSRLCGLFKLWRGDGSHRDLMMKVSLD